MLIANFIQDVSIDYFAWSRIFKSSKTHKKCRFSLFNTTLFIISEPEYI
jgi:hypothetical protein